MSKDTAYVDWDSLQALAQKHGIRQPFPDESLYEYRMTIHMNLLIEDRRLAFEVRFRKPASAFTNEELATLLFAPEPDEIPLAPAKGRIILH